MKIEAPSLAALKGIRHAFFTRRGGVSSGLYDSLNGGMGSQDDLACVSENRARMAGALGIAPDNLVACWQVHSPDATITVADCGPVLFADPEARVVGAAHAGWKGAFGGVVEGTVAAMERLGARRANIHAAIGPLIRQPSYEVGEDFVARFRAVDPAFLRFFAAGDRAGHFMFDLPGFIAHRLAEAGIGHVEDLGLDTYSDPERFFSYRRSTHRGEADYGRLVAAITLA
ncbi:MAG: polyphenol oxidase [Azorhizobium sp. 32-67-21]|nr:MAG: polyphenol oxidase [Azorhizobium sp. 32-67-21]